MTMTRGGSRLPCATPRTSPMPRESMASSASTSTEVRGPLARSRARSAKTRGVNRFAGSLDSSRARFVQSASSAPRRAAAVTSAPGPSTISSIPVSGRLSGSSVLNRVSRNAPITRPSTAACVIGGVPPAPPHAKTRRRARRSRAARPAAPATVRARSAAYAARGPAPTRSTRRAPQSASTTSVRYSACSFPVSSPEARARPTAPAVAASSPRRSSLASSSKNGAQSRSAREPLSAPARQSTGRMSFADSIGGL